MLAVRNLTVISGYIFHLASQMTSLSAIKLFFFLLTSEKPLLFCILCKDTEGIQCDIARVWLGMAKATPDILHDILRLINPVVYLVILFTLTRKLPVHITLKPLLMYIQCIVLM